jgi:hypothetical protein
VGERGGGRSCCVSSVFMSLLLMSGHHCDFKAAVGLGPLLLQWRDAARTPVAGWKYRTGEGNPLQSCARPSLPTRNIQSQGRSHLARPVAPKRATPLGRMRRRDLISMLGGAAIAWPLAVLAQQPGKVYRMAGVIPSGLAYFLNEKTYPRNWRPFFEELRRLGFVEGQNLTVERYSGEGQADRYADLARRVVASKPDVILCTSDRLAAHLKAATATIPIVALASGPVAFGLVPSLAHPAGNSRGWLRMAASRCTRSIWSCCARSRRPYHASPI